MKRRGLITERIIEKVRSLSKEKMALIAKEIKVLEPKFSEWAKKSTENDIGNVRYSGIIIQSEEAAKNLASVILSARYEGYFMAMEAADSSWDNKFLINDEDNEEEPYFPPVEAFMSGTLPKKYYSDLESKYSDEIKNNDDHWAAKALKAFKKNNSRSSNPDMEKHLKNKVKGKSSTNNFNSSLGDVGMTP